jgi:uncharacterized membrane protein HdeD (DUF308 family)
VYNFNVFPVSFLLQLSVVGTTICAGRGSNMRHLSSRSKNWILILGTVAWLVAVIVQFQLPSDSLWGQLLNVINLVLAVALIISGVGRLFWQRVERQGR